MIKRELTKTNNSSKQAGRIESIKEWLEMNYSIKINIFDTSKSYIVSNNIEYAHADPDLITRYGRGYRTKYPYTKNEDGEKVKVDFTNFTFVPLEGMRGSKSFFITPQENFKHLVSRDPQSRKMYAQAENYSVKIFAEWWEGVGFWIAEAIFAYLPPAPVGSGSAGGV